MRRQVVDDDRRSFASVTVPGGTVRKSTIRIRTAHCFTNMQVFEITGCLGYDNN